jgi:hypothetical protein
MNPPGLPRLGGARFVLSSPQSAGPLAPPAHTPKLGVTSAPRGTYVHFGFIGEVTRCLMARGDTSPRGGPAVEIAAIPIFGPFGLMLTTLMLAMAGAFVIRRGS